ncbi:hypothetical protein GCM10010964_05000 [Caldovatus sediminis]|uniref:histidine kinase n=1 Tax=Caldovatus sediminis TaxID=2041189 RepID=A0A8J3EB56_9PROT|nr:ATP-binding protein [Caldovatus sediminis]GGG19766.1 hypothetical protein GCM10010964_05000 [Caldovatus sediminis]
MQQPRHLARGLADAAAGAAGAHQLLVQRVMLRLERLRGRGEAEADAQDLAEILGNLAENAAQWARSRVRVAARRGEEAADAGLVALAVEDDGPGIPQEAAETALSRGGRLDATKPGTGLGLAIVADLAEAYGGSLALRRSRHLGGLCAEVRLPARAGAGGAAGQPSPASPP